MERLSAEVRNLRLQLTVMDGERTATGFPRKGAEIARPTAKAPIAFVDKENASNALAVMTM